MRSRPEGRLDARSARTAPVAPSSLPGRGVSTVSFDLSFELTEGAAHDQCRGPVFHHARQGCLQIDGQLVVHTCCAVAVRFEAVTAVEPAEQQTAFGEFPGEAVRRVAEVVRKGVLDTLAER